MLITPAVQQQLDQEIESAVRRVTVALLSPNGDHIPRLQMVFLLGKVAALTHPDQAKKMTLEELSLWVHDHKFRWSSADEAQYNGLQDLTKLWIAGIGDELTKQIRHLVLRFNESWMAELTRRDAEGNLRKGLWDSLKSSFVNMFSTELGNVFAAFEWTVSKFMNSELARFFQKGQASEIPSDMEVYKIPRPQACAYCFDLHVNPDGSPIIYQLSDIENNSNVGLKAADWDFTIGPVHPNCYCVLYTVGQSDPVDLGPDEFMANSRKEVMAVGLSRRQDLLDQAQAKFAEAARMANSE